MAVFSSHRCLQIVTTQHILSDPALNPSIPSTPTKAIRRSKRSHAFKHALWKTALVLRGKQYRMSEVRRILLAALEHLHVIGDARAMEAESRHSGTTLVIVVAWDLQLPTLETVALSRYLISKVEAITGLTYAQHDVFFEKFLPPVAELTEQQTSSQWLRERIRKLTNSVRKAQLAAEQLDDRDYPEASDLTSLDTSSRHVHSSARQPLSADETLAMIAAIRKRLNQTRNRQTGDEGDGSASTRPPHEKDTIIDGFLTVHSDLTQLT